jgi:hypothetical protein
MVFSKRFPLALQVRVLIVTIFFLGTQPSAIAGLRGPGKYAGVVVFDRWDNCLLVSGPYLMYISATQKERLRSYAGVSIEINASRVTQPWNPGDGLIREFEILGAAPEPESDAHEPEAVGLHVRDDFSGPSEIAFTITIFNHGSSEAQVRSDQIGVTVIGTHKTIGSPSDGSSEAALTRASLARGAGWSKFEWTDDRNRTYYARLKTDSPASERIALLPGESKDVRVVVDVSPGDYDFLVGYAHGVLAYRSLISNRVSFHVDKSGKARRVD